jgi:hypothetical protein
MGAYGRVVHLQAATFKDGWVFCGKQSGENLPGTPVHYGDYPVQIKTGYRLQESDMFGGKSLSLMWQTPANKGEGWYELRGGLQLNCLAAPQTLDKVPQVFTAKVTRSSCKVVAVAQLNFIADGDEAGLCVLGESYAYVRVAQRGGSKIVSVVQSCGDGEREVLALPFEGDEVKFTLSIRGGAKSGVGERLSCGINKNLSCGVGENFKGEVSECVVGEVSENFRCGIGESFRCTFYLNGKRLPFIFTALPGKWVGAKIGLFARNTVTGLENGLNNSVGNSCGSATFKCYKVK